MNSRRRSPLACCAAVVVALAAVSPALAAITLLDEPVSGEVDIRAELPEPAALRGDGRLRVVFCYKDEGNNLYLEAASDGLRLGMRRDGQEEELASSADVPGGGEAPCELTIKRRAWSIRVLVDGRCVLAAYEDFAPGDRIGYEAAGLKIGEVYSQPIGEMVFDDDFARPPDEPNPWETVEGQWSTSLPETRNRQVETTKSANPFSYAGQGSRALALAGMGFWDGYQVRAAVKAKDPGFVGLAFYARDKRNYYLLRVPVTEAGATEKPRAELLAVVDGKARSLADGECSLVKGQWAELKVRAHDGVLDASVDGETVCSARDDTFGEGQIGLYMEACGKGYFDDVALRPYRHFSDGYSAEGDMPVDQLAGRWLIHEDRLCGSPDAANKLGIALTGCTAWENYELSADVLPWSATSVGLCFGCTDKQNYYLFRWGPSHDNPAEIRQELWRIEDGKGEVLATRPKSFEPARTYPVTVTVDRQLVSVSVDGERVLETVDLDRVSAGKVGYYVEGTSQAVAAFDNMDVRFLDPPAAPVSITEQFAKEDTMADWARPLASWQALGNRLYAYTLPAWGDYTLRMELEYFVGRTGTVDLCMADSVDGLPRAESLMQVSSQRDEQSITCGPAESVDGVSGKVQTTEKSPMLVLERRGGTLTARLDGKAFAWARVPDGIQAPWVALKLGGVGVNLNNVTLTSPNILDASFSGAPTDWRPQDGLWEISDRWNCQPQWSWFCGRDAETPLIWNKRKFSGDMVFEFWACMMMDLPRSPGYSHPSDINGIICGDGENLCSGYAFVLAGDNNTRSKIIRQGKTVAETTAVKFENPTSGGDLNAFHRHWFHCRMERSGSKLTYYVDGKKALEFDDPDPLGDGYVGIWTHQRNGILLARTRVAFQGE